MNKLYSKLTIKSFSEDTRELTGIASTPAPDSDSDTIDPHGASFDLPFPLLEEHNPSKPIGEVTHAVVTDKGIIIRATIAKDTGLGYIDDMYKKLKSGLVKGLSIGFSATKAEPNEFGGLHFSKYDIRELSAVTIPANREATISTIKSICKDGTCQYKAKILKAKKLCYNSLNGR